MRNQRVWGWLKVALVTAFVVVTGATTALAQSSSNNYQMTEMEFGGTSGVESCSESYCAQVTIGESGDSNTATTAAFSEAAYSEPMIEVIIEQGESNMGVVSTEVTGTKTSKIKVRNYDTGGYSLQIIGDAPQFDGHSLNASTVPTASVPGTEQFGINLAANTTPTVGAAPVQLPNVLVYGQATDDYDTPNLFKFVSGDTIAESVADSGQTEFTLSMIINISNSTPAGKYTSDYATFVIPAY